MYNLHHSRSTFKLGTPVKVVMGAGLDSGREGRVCKHFTPEDGYENYLKGKGWIPVEDSRGKFYMAANYLRVKR
jgi:hypothetical protein